MGEKKKIWREKAPIKMQGKRGDFIRKAGNIPTLITQGVEQ